VDLQFEKDRTVFTFWCSARVIGKGRHDKQTHESIELARLPPNTWGIVIDDSNIQRKLMDRFLKIAGVESKRRMILGKNAEEIYSFPDVVIDVLKSNPNDKVLLIADENLDVVDGAAKHSTVSGSLCIEKILGRLEPSEDRRFLALVRSANDSSKELSLYTARAHGYLLKAPIDKDGVMGSIKDWWFKRFADGAIQSEENLGSNCSCESDGYDPFYDIIQLIEVIAALCKVGSVKSLRNRWRSVQEKLQALKGDLKSVISDRGGNDSLDSVIAEIDRLRLGDFPLDLHQRWATLQSQLFDVINAIGNTSHAPILFH